MPNHEQARIDDMAPTGKKKRSPVSAIVILAIFALVVGIIVSGR
jgi:hypothetical protein